MRLLQIVFKVGLYTFLGLCYLQNLSACADSVLMKNVPVQCNGLRNGVIEIKKVYGGLAPYLYSIDGQSFSTNPQFDRLRAGDYLVYVKDASGCARSWPVHLPEPEPLQVKLIIQDTLVQAGEFINLKAEIAPEQPSLGLLDWRPDGLFERDDTLLQHIQLSQNAQIVVEISDKNRCVARDVRNIFVDETNIFVPNIFRPNSDQNAWFTIFAGAGLSSVKALQVFGRNGEQVFQHYDFAPNDPLSGWNGRYNGKYVQSGVYSWAAELKYFDGSLRKKYGTVTVIY